MTAPPRKRAPAKRALRAVPDPEPQPLGRNKAHAERQKTTYPLGPDMPPGLPLSHLPAGTVVPPKPKTEPKAEYPGSPARRDGHPEWQLYTTFSDENPVLAVSREWRVRWVPPDERRCQARGVGKSNHWQGNRCVLLAIKGAKVCRFHGGNLPNVKKAAQTALAIAALPAAEKLIHIALKKGGVSDADRIKAIIQILDRAGVSGQQTVTVELSLWQKTLQSVYANNLAEEGEEIPGRELVEGEDYEVPDDEELEYGDGE
jgi:hypothetical protein